MTAYSSSFALLVRGLFGFWFAFGGLAIAQSPSFTDINRERYLGPDRGYVAIGDFNGDGKSDIVSGGPKSITARLGNGHGEFPQKIESSLSSSVFPRIAGDFNGDGKLDIVGFHGDSARGVAVLLGAGDGTFGQPLVIPGLNSSSDMAAADLNHDGKLDLIVADGLNKLIVLIGNGDGTFRSPVSYPIANSVGGMAVADFNGDGNLDVVLDSYFGFTFVPGNGDGTFGPAVPTVISYNFILTGIANADFNGDGIMDLVIDGKDYTNPNVPYVFVFIGKGDGTFVTGGTYTISRSSGLDFQQALTADFNGDGKPDVALLGSQVVTMLGNGDGTLQSPLSCALNILISPLVPFAVADFNGDGKPDVVAGDSVVHAISILFGLGDGRFREPPSIGVGDNPGPVVLGDFNNDGRLDYAVTYRGASHGVAIGLGRGDGTFSDPKYVLGYSGSSILAGDFNRDGNLDLVVQSFAGYQEALMLGNGDGTFQSPLPIPIGRYGYGTVAGDFNGDGNLDLIVPGKDGFQIWYLAGDGKGGFASPLVIPLGGTSLTALATGDFNLDGNLDVLVTTFDHFIVVFLGNGDGTFRRPVFSDTPASGPGSLAVADLNGDHIPDLVSNDPIDYVLSPIYVQFGKGDGSFGSPVVYHFAEPPTSVSVADINLDGKPDIVAGYFAQVSVMTGNGDGTFQPSVRFPTQGSESVAVGDLNGDGKPDLVISGGQKWLTLLLNTTP